jgi:hypothetical protein
MAVIRKTLCDLCAIEGAGRVYVSISTSQPLDPIPLREGSLSLDLCQPHYDQIIKRLIAVFADFVPKSDVAERAEEALQRLTYAEVRHGKA